MNLSRDKLYRIILEEYLISEGYWDHRGDDAAEELLKKILGDKYKSPEDRGHTRHITKGGDTAPMEKPHADGNETMPVDGDIPSDDAPESDYSGFQDRSGPPLEDQIAALIQGMPPEEVSDLFQAVFAKIPGVELGPPEDEEPESLYAPGAEGRPVAGFQLQELMELIREVLKEGHYHDMGGEDEMYNALDPHGFEDMSDAELIDMMHTDGMEEMIVLDGEGDLANREEVIAALQDV